MKHRIVWRRLVRRRSTRGRGLLAVVVAVVTFGGADLVGCDFCNCITGINPDYNGSNSIGLTILWQNSSSMSSPLIGSLLRPAPSLDGSWGVETPGRILHGGHGTSLDEEGNQLPVSEERISFELSWCHHLSRHVSATLLLPVVHNQITGANHTSLWGVGDATVMAHYVADQIFSERTPSTLLIGGGVTLPTGKNSMTNSEGVRLDNRLQPGSGSLGFSADATLMIPVGTWTISSNLRGRMNTRNSYRDRNGATLSAASIVSHDLYRNNPLNVGVIGSIGLRGEAGGQDMIGGSIDTASGSQTLWVQGGGQFVYHNLKFESALLIPVVQNRSELEGSEGPRLTVGVRVEYD